MPSIGRIEKIDETSNRTTMNTTDIIVVGPTGMPSHGMVIAACRAGGMGFLQATDSHDELKQQLNQVAPHVAGHVGVSFDHHTTAALAMLADDHHPQLGAVLVPASALSEHVEALRQFRANDIHILVECCQRDQFETIASAAREVRIDGVILKGNEASGMVSGTTAYILCQQWCEDREQDPVLRELPFWVRGCIGIRSVAAVAIAGARGVVLDSQLLLTRESELGSDLQNIVRSFDGSESVSLGSQLGLEFRICDQPGSATVAALGDLEDEIAASEGSLEIRRQRWAAAVQQKFEARRDRWPLYFLGPDAALAADLAEQYVTVAGIMQAIAAAANEGVAQAAQQQLLASGAPLAESHGTTYPILQGPMTRVSDVPEFAKCVADGGGLPFLALALLREKQAEPILRQAAELLADQSWGVGLLGFLPPEIREEQIRAIRKHKPPYAIIAGGRPDQARVLEDEGITTYLHVPSPGLLKMFLRDGATHFILEGRECGGHVGPRTSFLLWEQQLRVLEEHLQRAKNADDFHVVFAGGIHDGLSAAMAVAMAAPLAERGVRVGVLMGTAYLFTAEAVETGAIVPKFQEAACETEQTVLFETGPGHAVRCVNTPYYQDFVREKVRLKKSGKKHKDIVMALERMNVGRLRVASKGMDRVAAEPGAPRQLVTVNEDQQHERGMYMVGQVASLHNQTTTIEQLHRKVAEGASALRAAAAARIVVRETPRKTKPCDVAIVGMSCFYPGANSLREYWDNILHSKYAVKEVPGSHWDWQLYYDEDRFAKDKIISKWGGFLGDIPFDPLRYGITPKSLESIEPLQLLLLEAMQHCVNDAGYEHRPFNRENACAVLGIGGGGSPMGVAYGIRSSIPMLATIPGLNIDTDDILEKCDGILPEWTEDSFPGFLMNVAVGRVANRFDLGGSNYALDAACASSLAAVHACVRELELGTTEVAFAMGADTVQTPYSYMAFSKTHALSPQGRCRPFDDAADGIVLSEGVGIVMLKRLADAERDGDRIYAVIRGVGSSSDGRDKGLTAPNAAGQMRALRRAYEQANICPSRVGLIEAHGTGTVVGDKTESQALATVLRENGADRQSCALGSVKSMIGHSKCAAGVAGLIKTALALHHKVLPPTLVETPNESANFSDSALFLNRESRPWVNDRSTPRCAGVSAFGFGGTNVHVVLEEYQGGYLQREDRALTEWTSELFLFRAADVPSLAKQIDGAIAAWEAGCDCALTDYAAALSRAASKSQKDSPHGPTLAIVAESESQLLEHLGRAKQAIDASQSSVIDPRGLYYVAETKRSGQVAMLFPGQGSQYPNMLADTAVSFAEVRSGFDDFTQMLAGAFESPLSRYIFPPSSFNDEAKHAARKTLAQTQLAQPAIGAASMGMYRLLTRLGIAADAVGGHSYGEYTALWAAGALSDENLIDISYFPRSSAGRRWAVGRKRNGGCWRERNRNCAILG